MSTRTTIKIPRKMYREFPIELGARQEGKEGADSWPLSFSSEIPVLRWTWDGEYYEILSHNPGDIDLERAKEGLPALKSHNPFLHFGSVTEIELDKKARRLRGVLSVSSIDLGQEQATMIEEGHLRTVSVGYEILSFTLESGGKEEIPTYRCKWKPLEVSPTPIPADFDVGIGRGRSDEGKRGELNLVEIKIEDPAAGGERTMAQEVKGEAAEAPTAPVAPEAPAARVKIDTEIRDRGAEAAEISELCAEHGFGERAADWIREGATPDQVRRVILKEIQTHGLGAPGSEAVDIMAGKDRKRYSVQRALRIAGNMEKMDGLEAEVHAELATQRGRGPDHGGLLIPWRERGPEDLRPLSQRVLGTGEATGGATLVDAQTMPEMIDLLRNKAMVLVLGARLYPGLQGTVQFNKKTGAPTVYWMGENPAAAAAQSQPTYAYVTLGPKTLIGTVQIPRQLIATASIDVEADIRTDLATGHALAFDLAALHGLGSDKQPEGIYQAADVLVHAAGGVPDFADIGTMIGKLADANADFGALAWITTPLMASLMSRTVLVANYPKFLWEGTVQEGTMLGYRAVATNQVSKTLEGAAKHGLIFGNWNDLVLGLWGNDLEVVVDQLTRAAYGQIIITSYSMADTALRRGQSFCKATGATIV